MPNNKFGQNHFLETDYLLINSEHMNMHQWSRISSSPLTSLCTCISDGEVKWQHCCYTHIILGYAKYYTHLKCLEKGHSEWFLKFIFVYLLLFLTGKSFYYNCGLKNVHRNTYPLRTWESKDRGHVTEFHNMNIFKNTSHPWHRDVIHLEPLYLHFKITLNWHP
jgi:hypothetical protein